MKTTIRVLHAVCLLSLACAAVRLQAQATADQVKAAYLYNFGRYVRWPVDAASDDPSFAICVFSQDPLETTLKTAAAGEELQGRAVTVQRVASAQEAAGCRILFIGAKQTAHLHSLLAGLDRSAVLTVSDIPGFLEQGGMIQFVLGRDNMRFKVDLSNISRVRLVMSSELLKVAAAVQGSVPPGGE